MPPDPLHLTFEVTTDSAEVAAFAAALGLVAAGERATSVPLTYPVRWMSDERVRTWLEANLGGGLPVHEMQDFAYRAPLALGRSYTLRLMATPPEPGADRFLIEAEVLEGEALVCTARSSILRVRLAGPT